MRLAMCTASSDDHSRVRSPRRERWKAIGVADADFAIVNAEIPPERTTGPVSQEFVDAYRVLKPEFPIYFSSFGRA